MGMLQKTILSGSNEPVLTVADLRTKYGFHFQEAQNGYFENMILAAQRACAAYMGMDTLEQTIECTEVIDTEKGQWYVSLSGSPLKSVTSVLDGDAEVSSYLVNHGSGLLRIPGGCTSEEMTVNYVVGWDSIPEDVLYCVAMTVQHMSRVANSALMGKNSMSTEGGSETYEQSVVPLAVRQYLNRYCNGWAV